MALLPFKLPNVSDVRPIFNAFGVDIDFAAIEQQLNDGLVPVRGRIQRQRLTIFILSIGIDSAAIEQ